MGSFYSCNADDEDRQNRAFAESLVEKGHTCVVVFDSYPAEVQWCGQDECTENDDYSNVVY